MKARIIAEDQHILVCYKPAGLAVQSGRVGEADLVSELKNHLAAGGKAPYLGLIHRLDQPVAGLLVFAKTKQAAAELSRQAAGMEDETGTEAVAGSKRDVKCHYNCKMQKEYRALVYLSENMLKSETIFSNPGEKRVLTDYLRKENGQNTSVVVSQGTEGAKKSVLELETETLHLDPDGRQGYARIRVRLMTGRHHQIRVQCANAGFPLLGDSKYGSLASRQYSMKKRIRTVALCAWRLGFTHPASGKRMEFEAEELPWKTEMGRM